MLVTTHYLDEAEYCGRLSLMHAGRVIAVGTPAELRGLLGTRAMLEVRADDLLEALAVLERDPAALEVAAFGTALHVLVEQAAEGSGAIREALAGFRDVQVRPIVPSLEDVFIHAIEHA